MSRTKRVLRVVIFCPIESLGLTLKHCILQKINYILNHKKSFVHRGIGKELQKVTADLLVHVIAYVKAVIPFTKPGICRTISPLLSVGNSPESMLCRIKGVSQRGGTMYAAMTFS